jgi:hypothetical protein
MPKMPLKEAPCAGRARGISRDLSVGKGNPGLASRLDFEAAERLHQSPAFAEVPFGA